MRCREQDTDLYGGCRDVTKAHDVPGMHPTRGGRGERGRGGALEFEGR